MKLWFVLWDKLVLAVWADAERTALQCEEFHKRFVERVTRK